MSRADQSLTRQTPKTCRSVSASGTGRPGREGVPTTKPTSASMSSRAVGANVISLPGARSCPRGRTTGVPETTMVPDRPW